VIGEQERTGLNRSTQEALVRALLLRANVIVALDDHKVISALIVADRDAMRDY